MNKNYAKGVRWERQIMREMEQQGYACTRASGSHSRYDVIAYRVDRKPQFIQAKTTKRRSEAERLVREFKETTIPSEHYHQKLYIKAGVGMLHLYEITL